MEKVIKKTAIKVSKETAIILLTVMGSVLLPQIVHAAGVLLGIGGKLGQILLPMYLPVLIIGFYRGAPSGVIAGSLSPLVSFWITGMPAQAILPYITVELVATGLFAGILSRVKLHALLRVLAVQVIAKAIRLTALVISQLALNGAVNVSALFSGILLSLPGVLLQLTIVTLLICKKETKQDA